MRGVRQYRREDERYGVLAASRIADQTLIDGVNGAGRPNASFEGRASPKSRSPPRGNQLFRWPNSNAGSVSDAIRAA